MELSIFRKIVNGLFFGSPEGPAIKVDWEDHKVTLGRMPRWLATLVMEWLFAGEVLDQDAAE